MIDTMRLIPKNCIESSVGGIYIPFLRRACAGLSSGTPRIGIGGET